MTADMFTGLSFYDNSILSGTKISPLMVARLPSFTITQFFQVLKSGRRRHYGDYGVYDNSILSGTKIWWSCLC